LIALAPQSASWRTQVGPARTRDKSSTVKPVNAFDARGKGKARTPRSFPARRRERPELPRSDGCCLPAPAFAVAAIHITEIGYLKREQRSSERFRRTIMRHT
jgi:hypothetical protein